MNKKILIGLVAVVALAGAAFTFSAMGGGFFKGDIGALKGGASKYPGVTTVSTTIPGGKSILDSTASNCADVEARYSAMEAKFATEVMALEKKLIEATVNGVVVESSVTRAGYAALRKIINDYDIVGPKSDIVTCKLTDFVAGLKTNISTKFKNMTIVSMSKPFEMVAWNTKTQTTWRTSVLSTRNSDTYLHFGNIDNYSSVKTIKEGDKCLLTYADYVAGVLLKCKVPSKGVNPNYVNINFTFDSVSAPSDMSQVVLKAYAHIELDDQVALAESGSYAVARRSK